MKENVETILKEIGQNLDNPEWLSKSCVALSSILFYHNTRMAKAELAEKDEAVRLLQEMAIGGKRMSVAESEKRAVVKTENEYGILKAQAEAIKEGINAIKMRIRVLTWERQNQNGGGRYEN